MKWLAIALISALAVRPAGAETLKYSIFTLGPGESRQLLTKEVKRYDPAHDIAMKTLESSQDKAIRKSLQLMQGFSISVIINPEKDLKGFGLSIRNNEKPNGFSWEWFQADKGDVFKKLQGKGRLKVTIVRREGLQELIAIRFLQETTLRFIDDIHVRQKGEFTHAVVVKKGSVLRLTADD